MIEITIKCESCEEAQRYLSAPSVYSLISDFANAVRTAKKYGDDKKVLEVLDSFEPDFWRVVDFETDGLY
jgi:7,8-dihydro-6-hydroxymethylpterin-pyrophosphokinase